MIPFRRDRRRAGPTQKGLDLVLYTARLDTFEHDFHVENLPLQRIVRHVTSEQSVCLSGGEFTRPSGSIPTNGGHGREMALFCTADADQCGSVYTEGTRHPF